MIEERSGGVEVKFHSRRSEITLPQNTLKTQRKNNINCLCELCGSVFSAVKV